MAFTCWEYLPNSIPMNFNCEQICKNKACKGNLRKYAFYKNIVNTFLKSNYFLQVIPDSLHMGVFLYDTKKEGIVYADERFLESNGIKRQLFEWPAMRRLIVSRMHDDDVRRLMVVKRIAQKKGHAPFLNGVLRFKNHGSYRSYQFLVVKPEIEGCHANHFRIGVQMKHSPLQNNTEDELDQVEHYQQMIIALSEREREVLQLIVQGKTDKEVGEKLFISLHTAKKHRKNILKKLNVKNTASLAFIAGQSSLLN